MKLADLGEFGFIERIRSAAAVGPGVLRGIGDDCAVLELPPGHLLLTSKDMLIEGVHFKLSWSGWRALGRKSVMVNISDIAAMGGAPRYLYLGLGVPESASMEELNQFLDGFLEAAAEYNALLVGGDTCRSPGPLLISVTVEGTVPKAEVVSRGGARPGDGIYVSGTLGDSALGLRQLLKGEKPGEFLARRHFDPQPRISLGRALAEKGLVSAMIDLSDGLLGDLGHILKASSAGAVLEEERVPLSADFRQALQADPSLLQLALAGGEDYELLFTVPPEKEPLPADLASLCGVDLTRIGVICEAKDGLRIRDARGGYRSPEAGGFNHFRSG